MKIIGSTFASVYQQLLESVYSSPEYISKPRGLEVKETTNVLLEIEEPWSNLWQNVDRPFPVKYLAGELIWYFSGRNDIEFISNFSKFWKKIANEDGTANSAYGYSIFKENNQADLTEWQWAYNSLINDKDTRQAIVHINKPKHMFKGNKDFPCTIYGHFMIRDNKLNFTTNMRSQDLHKGMSFDIPFFTLLQEQMLIHLRAYYPELERGKYQHFVSSMHIYESDYEITEKMLSSGITAANLPAMEQSLIRPDGEALVDWNNIRESNDPLLQWIYNHSKSV